MEAKEFDPFEIKNHHWLNNFEKILEYEPVCRLCTIGLAVDAKRSGKAFWG